MNSYDKLAKNIALSAILNSWEDEDLNRHFPNSNGRALLRDGCYGTWRGIVEIEPPDIAEQQSNAAE
jgi:hypothetical protein